MLPGRGGREKSVEILKGWQRLLQPFGEEHCVSTEALRVFICLGFKSTAWHAPCQQASASLQGTNLCCATAHRMLLSGAWSSCALASLTPSSWVRVLK